MSDTTDAPSTSEAASIVAKMREKAAKAAVARRVKKIKPPPPPDRPWHVVTGGPLNLDGVRDKAYNKTFLNIIFTVSSAILLGFVGIMIHDDYDREWREYQQSFRDAKVGKLRKELLEQEQRFVRDKGGAAELLSGVSAVLTGGNYTVEQLEAKRQQVAAKIGEFSGEAPQALVLLRTYLDELLEVHAGLAERKGYIDSLDVAIAEKAGQIFLENNMIFQIEKSVIDTDRRTTDEKIYHHPELPGAAATYASSYYRVSNLFKNYERTKGELDALERKRSEIMAEKVEKERTIQSLLDAWSTVSQKYAHESHWAMPLFDAPLFDFIAPNLVVEGVITKNLFNDYNFNQVRKIDHCMTCHFGIDKPGFEDGVDLGGGEDGLPDGVPDLTGNPYLTHPRRALLLGGTHPMKEFGCTVCHGGNGHALDFVHAAHVPGGQPEERKAKFDWKTHTGEWDEKYNYYDVWMADVDHYWDWPQLPKEYLTASCSKCHLQEQVIPGADLLNHGRELIEKKGCYGCHRIDMDGLRVDVDARKVGPDLRHVGQKLQVRHDEATAERLAALDAQIADLEAQLNNASADAPEKIEEQLAALRSEREADPQGTAFVQRWLWYPKVFRDTTHMPRFWGNLNNSSGVDLLRAEAEVRSVTRLILSPWSGQVAEGQTVGRELEKPDFTLAYAAKDVELLRSSLDGTAVPDHLKEAAELVAAGRNAFKNLGCLGCHTNSEDGLGTEVHGPNLDRIGSKVTPSWLYDWLRNPKRHWQTTVMPDLRLSEAEATRIANYLMLFREESWYAADILADSVYVGEKKLASMLVLVDGLSSEAAEAQIAEWSADEKARALEERALPYMVLSRVGDVRADLRTVEKELRDPDLRNADGSYLYEGKDRNARRKTRDASIEAEIAGISDDREVARRLRERMLTYMVYQKLSDNYASYEARAMAHGMNEDERLLFVGNDSINRYGCFGCHDINGYLNAQPIGTELTFQGSKDLEKLDFGFWHHRLEHNKQDWFLTKILNPRIFDVIPYHHEAHEGEIDEEALERNPYLAYVGGVDGDDRQRNQMTKLEKDKLRMPQFDLTREEAKAITCFLLGRVSDPIPEEMRYKLDDHHVSLESGRRIVRKFNCAGCHIIGNDIELYVLPPASEDLKALTDKLAQVEKTDSSGTLSRIREQLAKLRDVTARQTSTPFAPTEWDLAALTETGKFRTGVIEFAKISALQYVDAFNRILDFVPAAKAAGDWGATHPNPPTEQDRQLLKDLFSSKALQSSFNAATGFTKNIQLFATRPGKPGAIKPGDEYLAGIEQVTKEEVQAFFAAWAEEQSKVYTSPEETEEKKALERQVATLDLAHRFLERAAELGAIYPLNHFWVEGDVYLTKQGPIQGHMVDSDAVTMKFRGMDTALSAYAWDDVVGIADDTGRKAPLAEGGAILTAKYAQVGGTKTLAKILLDAGVTELFVRGLGEGAYRDMVDVHTGLEIFPAEQKANAPPILPDQGEKADSEWLFGFLKRPYKLRPAVTARMPTFGFTDAEAMALTRYFAAKDEVQYPFQFHDEEPLTEEERTWAEGFITVNCKNCHVGADRSAPTLGLAADRLRTDWLASWILVPEHRQPNTKMIQVFFSFSKKLGSLAPYINGVDGNFGPGLRPPSVLGTEFDAVEGLNDAQLEELRKSQTLWRLREIDVLRRYFLNPDFNLLDPSGDRFKRQ